MTAVSLCFALNTEAQTPPVSGDDEPYEEIRIDPRDDVFKPAEYGMTELTDRHTLYEVLTRFCPEGKRGKEGVPCAFISYPSDKETYQISLRPVLKVVSRDKIWTFFRGQVALISLSTLERAGDFLGDEPDSNNSYTATAIVGTEENKNRCDRGLLCVDTAYFSDIVREKKLFTPGCIKEIWAKRGGPRDPGDWGPCQAFHD